MQGDLAYGQPGTANPDRTRSLFGQAMGLVAITAGCFTLAAYLNRGGSSAGAQAGFIFAYVCLVAMKLTVRRSTAGATVLLLVFGALLVLIVSGIVLIFMHVSPGALIYSALGLLIFAGLIMADFQRLRRSRNLDSGPLITVSIFLDALNVFLVVMRFIAGGTEG